VLNVIVLLGDVLKELLAFRTSRYTELNSDVFNRANRRASRAPRYPALF